MAGKTDRKGEAFAGVTVALVTPMRQDGSVDFEALGRLVDWHVEQGTDGLAPVGTTGESPTLTHDEHREVISAVCKRANGRIRVMAGTGSNSTSEAIELTKFAAGEGADGALLVSPYYNKPTQEGYFRHFVAIADAVELPLVLYNIPGRTASNILPETICRIGEHPHVVAIKEATGSMDQSSAVLAGSRLTVLSGDDSLTLPMMSLGASGVVSVVGNIVPARMKALVEAFRGGDPERAREIHYELYGLCRDMLSLATNPIPIKSAMKILGRDTGVLRLPLCSLEEGQESALRKTLSAAGLA